MTPLNDPARLARIHRAYDAARAELADAAGGVEALTVLMFVRLMLSIVVDDRAGRTLARALDTVHELDIIERQSDA